MAKVINIAVDVGSGFAPVGFAVRSGVKGVQAIGKASKGRAAKKAAETATKETVETTARQSDEVIEHALNEGLKADGVTGFERSVREGVAEAEKLAVKSAPDAATTTTAKLSPKDDFNASLEKYRKEMEEITKTKPHEVTLAEAEQLGISLDDLRNLIPGTALKESEMAAYLKALDSPVDTLIDLAKRTVAGEAGAGEAMTKALMEFFEFSPKFRAAEVTAGRSVEILKEVPPMKSITDLLLHWDPESIAKGDFAAAMRTVAEDITALADQPGTLKALQVQTRTMLQRIGEDWWPMAREAYTNLLLARPVTAARQIIGNTLSTATRSVEREVAGWLSIDKTRGVVRGEGWYDAKGKMFALGEAMEAFGNVFKNLSPEEAARLDFIPHKITGVMGRILNSPGDLVRGIDNFYRVLAKRGDYYSMALRKGVQQGLEGDELASYVAQRVTLPTQEMFTHAKAVADVDTFMQDLGTFGQLSRGVAQYGPLALYNPFWKSPINLIKWGFARMPGIQLLSQSLYRDIVAGGELADMAIARLTLSNLAGQFVWELAQSGLLTGGGPVDPQLRKSWLASKMPYSILGADGWYSISNAAEPGTTSVELIADLAEITNTLDDTTIEQLTTAVGLSLSRDVLDNTWWRSMGDLVRIATSIRHGEEIGQQGKRLLASPFITAVTGGPLGAAITRTIDPVRRETRSIMDEVRARTPGYSSTLPPIRDGFGDPVLVPQALGSKWVRENVPYIGGALAHGLNIASPFVASEAETDPIKKEAARLAVKLPSFPWSLGGKVADDFDLRTAQPGDPLPVELTPQQRDRWQVLYRNILRHDEMGISATLLNREEYKAGTYAAQREMFMDYLATARTSAKEALMVEDATLMKKAEGARVERYLPLLKPQERAGVEAQLGESLDLLDTLLPEQRQNLLKWGVLDSGADRDAEVIGR